VCLHLVHDLRVFVFHALATTARSSLNDQVGWLNATTQFTLPDADGASSKPRGLRNDRDSAEGEHDRF